MKLDYQSFLESPRKIDIVKCLEFQLFQRKLLYDIFVGFSGVNNKTIRRRQTFLSPVPAEEFPTVNAVNSGLIRSRINIMNARLRALRTHKFASFKVFAIQLNDFFFKIRTKCRHRQNSLLKVETLDAPREAVEAGPQEEKLSTSLVQNFRPALSKHAAEQSTREFSARLPPWSRGWERLKIRGEYFSTTAASLELSQSLRAQSTITR